MPHDRTSRLTRAIHEGDPRAFGAFYDGWFDRLAADARRMTGRDEAFCLDLVQDVMLKVVRSLPVLESEPALAGWLRRTMRRAAIDRLRSERRREARERRHARLPQRRATPAPDQEIERTEDRGVLAALLAELDPAERELLAMRHELRWTLARIGDALGLSPGAVDGRLARITGRLRTRAAESLGDEPIPDEPAR